MVARQASPEKIEERRRDVVRLHARGWSDRKIAATLGVSHYTIYLDRKTLALPANRKTRQHGTADCYRHGGCRRPECRAAHAEALRQYRRRRAERKHQREEDERRAAAALLLFGE